MKITVDVRTMSCRPSGIGIYTYDFLKALYLRGDISLTLLTDVTASEQIRFFEQQGIPIVSYGRRIFRSGDVYKYFSFVLDNLRADQPDLFWEPNNLIPVSLNGYSGKTVVTIHDIFPLTMKEYYSFIYRTYFRLNIGRTIAQTSALLFDSRWAKESICAMFPKAAEKQSLITYLIVNEPPRIPVTDDGYFLYVGNIEGRKGTDLLLKAYRLYREKGGDRPLCIAGNVSDEKLQPLLDELIQDYPDVRYPGYVSDDEKYHLMAGCSAFVFPSRAEGFGAPPIEALSYGKPVIASDLPIFEETIKTDIHTFPFNGSGEDVCESLSALLLNCDLTPYPQDTCDEVLENYRAEKLGERLARFFADVVNGDGE